MTRVFVSGAWAMGVALLALVAVGPSCTGGGGDDSDGGGMGGEDGGDGSGGAVSSGGASSGGAGTGGGAGEGLGGAASGGASGGASTTGGAGGLGGGGGSDCETDPSECTDIEDLGDYFAGESLPWLPSSDPLPPGESALFGITFLDAVWFGGALTTIGSGIPELTLYDAEGDEFVTFTGEWADHLLPAGDYFLRVAPAYGIALDEGYDLDMLTRNPFQVGTVTADSSSSTSALFDSAGQFYLYKFVVAAPIVFSGNITLTSGNVDIFLFDSAAEVVTSAQSPSDTETIGPLELPVGTYMIQVVGVTGSADFMALFEWDDP